MYEKYDDYVIVTHNMSYLYIFVLFYEYAQCVTYNI